VRHAARPLKPVIIEGQMLEAFGATDPGCVRANNEDCYLLSPAMGLYVVADGMGGAQAGETASKLSIETLEEIVHRNPDSASAATLVEGFHEANHRVSEAAAKDRLLEGMGTTMVAALVKNGEIHIASVGDSRAYLFDDGQLHAITEDQSWVNEVGRRLGIAEDILKTHPMRHVLTMAIGVSGQLRVLTYVVKPTAGMQLLLCSDGLHGVALEDEIKAALSAKTSLEEKCAALIAAAREHGGPDNITTVLLQAS
jgi:serine/threonine protein phosphatase PrpC